MKLLLDTHFLVWFATDQARITQSEMTAIEGAEQLLVSLLSIWELRTKWRKSQCRDRAHSLIRPDQALSFIDGSSIDLIPLNGVDLTATLNPPIEHGDPFDEMLLVHAQRLGARLLTRDRAMRSHPLVVQP